MPARFEMFVAAFALALVAMATAACGDDESSATSGSASSGSSVATSTSTSSGAGGEGGGGTFACPDSGVLHGPWSEKLDFDSAVVRWDACAEGLASITFEPEGGGASRTAQGAQSAFNVRTTFGGIPGATLPDEPGVRYFTEVTVDGLVPGTCYTFTLDDDDARGGRFCTARLAGEPFRFMAIGDTNPGIAPTEAVVDHVIALDPDFGVHLGDIQYYSSIVDSWAQWFISMQPLLSSHAFQPCIGNHEDEREFEFMDYYDRLFADAGFGGDRRHYKFESGGLHFFAVDSEGDLSIGSEQGRWLEASLAEAAGEDGFRGSVVYMHRPFISVGDGGSLPDYRAHYEPLFEDFGVRLVLSGHMHGYERFTSGNVVYVVSGGGGGLIGDVSEAIEDRPEEAALREAFAAAFHAMVFDVGAESIEGRAIDDSGEEIDNFSIPLP
jgi:hypothetical protein